MAHGHRCNVCGGVCKGGGDHSTLHLHVEIENLKQKLLERENHIVTMETNFLTEVDKFPNGEFAAMAEEVVTWQEKYSRLYEAHKRIQKVNQNLEDKLLKIVDKCETEKFNMAKEVITLKERLVDANATISSLKDENERSRNDVNIAIQLLQCKPSNFVSQKFESLPSELQHKVKDYMANKKKVCDGPAAIKHEVKTIKVPIPTFPPTAMFYSVNRSNKDDEEDEESGKSIDIVSAAIVAKILEEREKERQNIRHCDSCICPSRRSTRNCQTQTSECLGYAWEEAGIIRVESYQSPSPTVSSVTLIERSTSTGTAQSSTAANVPSAPFNIKRAEGTGTSLNLGRNRYHSSKLSREVNRRKEKAEQDLPTLRHSEIHIDDSGEVSCDIADVRLTFEKETNVDEDAIRRISERRPNAGVRKCSISIHAASSNALTEPATTCLPTAPAKTHHCYAFHQSSRSSSTSSMDDKPTETQI